MADEGQPFGESDPEQVAQFWQRFLSETGRDPDLAPPEPWAFGDSAELADKLLDLVLNGTKRATAGALADYEADGESVATVGDLEIVTDGGMRPRAVLQVTDVRVGPLSSVDDQFAFDEGEGDRSRDYWLDVHTRFFQRRLAHLGLEFDPDAATVFERFDLVYAED